MPLLKPDPIIPKETLRITIEKPALNEIIKYCEWAGIDKLDYFFSEASKYIFKVDKDWKREKARQEN